MKIRWPVGDEVHCPQLGTWPLGDGVRQLWVSLIFPVLSTHRITSCWRRDWVEDCQGENIYIWCFIMLYMWRYISCPVCLPCSIMKCETLCIRPWTCEQKVTGSEFSALLLWHLLDYYQKHQWGLTPNRSESCWTCSSWRKIELPGQVAWGVQEYSDAAVTLNHNKNLNVGVTVLR